MKRCFKCGVAKPLDDFYAHPRMADGHLNKCKACTRSDVTGNRNAKLEYYRAYDVFRFHNDAERRAAQYRTTRGLVETYPERKKARTAVSNAVRDGRLTRLPCEVCGAAKSEAHHDDYTQPLAVRWLCRRHHEQHHHSQVA